MTMNLNTIYCHSTGVCWETLDHKRYKNEKEVFWWTGKGLIPDQWHKTTSGKTIIVRIGRLLQREDRWMMWMEKTQD